MPKGTKVDRVYRALVREGKSKDRLRGIAQAKNREDIGDGESSEG